MADILLLNGQIRLVVPKLGGWVPLGGTAEQLNLIFSWVFFNILAQWKQIIIDKKSITEISFSYGITIFKTKFSECVNMDQSPIYKHIVQKCFFF